MFVSDDDIKDGMSTGKSWCRRAAAKLNSNSDADSLGSKREVVFAAG